MSINSNSHNFSVFIEAYFNPCEEILLSIKSLESVFFNTLYKNQKEESTLYFEDYNKKIKFDCSDDKLNFPQVGYKYNLTYGEIKDDNFEKIYNKELTVLVIKEEPKNREFKLYVKEKKGSELRNQYELTIEIKRESNGVLIYGKILLHSSIRIRSPFSKEFSKLFKKSLYNLSCEDKFVNNFKSYHTVVVNTSKKLIFAAYTKVGPPEGLEGFYTMEGLKGEKMMNYVGMKYKSEWLGNKLVFNIDEYDNPSSLEKDSYIAGSLYDSEPYYLPFSYKFQCTAINENTTLVQITHYFSKRLSPEIMNQHAQTVKAMMKNYKNKDYAKFEAENKELID